MGKAKFTTLDHKDLYATTPDPNPEILGMLYNIQLNDADGDVSFYRVTVLDGRDGDIWNITNDGTNIDPESRFGKKIIDFVKLEISTRVFVDDDAMDKWFNEQSV